jgi:hypothetical protein
MRRRRDRQDSQSAAVGQRGGFLEGKALTLRATVGALGVAGGGVVLGAELVATWKIP